MRSFCIVAIYRHFVSLLIFPLKITCRMIGGKGRMFPNKFTPNKQKLWWKNAWWQTRNMFVRSSDLLLLYWISVAYSCHFGRVFTRLATSTKLWRFTSRGG